MSKNYFLNLVKAYLKGDNDEVIAVSIQKNALAALKREEAILQPELLTAEAILDTAKEEYQKALINGGVSKNFDFRAYIIRLGETKQRIIEVEERIKDIKDKITFINESIDIVNGTKEDL